MGSGVCTIDSLTSGICPCHKSPVSYIGTFISGASSVNTNGKITCNANSIAVSTCGHVIMVITQSSTVNAEGTGVHRIGDLSQNCGTGIAITGSGNVNAGG